ncbi:MAG: threonine/serine exporter family protein [Lachnospiraceae bacterium]|nr:threonine/serine exporter family protein [Lachnospiraceae bacterium]
MIENVRIVFFTFGSALGIGAVYQVRREYLLNAGLGGALARIVFLLVKSCTAESFIYNFFAAMAAAFYAECMAYFTKNPSTMFLYPSIIPLTPGRAFYFTVIGLILKNVDYINEYFETCVHSLVGMGLGFAVISVVMHYQRRHRRTKKADRAAEACYTFRKKKG